MESDTLFFDEKEVCKMYCVKLFFSWFIESQYMKIMKMWLKVDVYENLSDGVCQFFFEVKEGYKVFCVKILTLF